MASALKIKCPTLVFHPITLFEAAKVNRLATFDINPDLLDG